MLTLTRKQGEVLLIGEDIIIVVLETHRGKVRIGVDAPKNMRVVSAKQESEAGRLSEIVSNVRQQVKRARARRHTSSGDR